MQALLLIASINLQFETDLTWNPLRITVINGNKTDDLFCSRLDQIIDLDEQLTQCYTCKGRLSSPNRLMFGLHILKHTHDLSDESVRPRREENPYCQYFCGEAYFQYRFAIESPWMIHFRQRVGVEF